MDGQAQVPVLFQVYIKHVYGLPKVYPANEVANKFAALLRVKTFSHSELCQIEALGFKVEQVEFLKLLDHLKVQTQPKDPSGLTDEQLARLGLI